MPEHCLWDRGGQHGRDRSRHSQFSPPTFARMQFGSFEHYSPGDLTSATTYPGWNVAVIGAGTLVMQDRVGGWMQMLCGGVENQGIQMQTGNQGAAAPVWGESFLPAANRDIHFGIRIEMLDVTECDMFVGLSIGNATLITAPAADLIGYWTHDGDANLDFQVQSTGSGAVGAVDTGVDLADGTAIELGFMVNGVTNVRTFINGALDNTFAVAAAGDIPVTEMSLSFAVLTGEGQPNDLKIDWYSIVQNYV